MQVSLPYGSGKLAVTLNDAWDATLIAGRDAPALADPPGAVQASLRNPTAGPPLAEFIGSVHRVGIVINDGTRPTPSRLLIEAALAELPGLRDDFITLFNATGTHRPNTLAELDAVLGAGLARRFEIVQNDARDESTQVSLGETRRGHPIWLDRRLLECDRLILTGFIEPHFFAGFSGGPKALMPGMVGMRTVLANHGLAMIADPHSTWGETRGNPIWEECAEVLERVGKSFLLNVALNREKAVTGVFTGEPLRAHEAGCAFVRESAMVRVAAPFDVVLTTNSGYPLDQNLYQSVKGMSAAASIVREGGAIVIAAECRDGVPEGSGYQALLGESTGPEALLARLAAQAGTIPDQWQAQIQAQIQRKAGVTVVSSLPEETVRRALFTPAQRVEDALAALAGKFGANCRIAILPDGPQVISYVGEETSPSVPLRRGEG